ncbi:MAG TPA: ammonium transporter, partial [Allocoleopsis sp.]
AGVACFYATQLIKRVLHIDDSLDVSPVHGVGGAIGTTLTGIFASTLFGGAGFIVQHSITAQLGVQVLGVIVVAGWCAAMTWLVLRIVDFTVGLRVSEEHETEGLDVASHGERGYGI